MDIELILNPDWWLTQSDSQPPRPEASLSLEAKRPVLNAPFQGSVGLAVLFLSARCQSLRVAEFRQGFLPLEIIRPTSDISLVEERVPNHPNGRSLAW